MTFCAPPPRYPACCLDVRPASRGPHHRDGLSGLHWPNSLRPGLPPSPSQPLTRCAYGRAGRTSGPLWPPAAWCWPGYQPLAELSARQGGTAGTRRQLATSSSGQSFIISARSCDGQWLPRPPMAWGRSILWYFVRVCCCRWSSFVYGASSSGCSTAAKHNWITSLPSAATQKSNCSHSSKICLARNLASTYTNHPATLSAQNGGRVTLTLLVIMRRCGVDV